MRTTGVWDKSEASRFLYLLRNPLKERRKKMRHGIAAFLHGITTFLLVLLVNSCALALPPDAMAATGESEAGSGEITGEDADISGFPINNGGNFVEYQGNTYYWKAGPDTHQNAVSFDGVSFNDSVQGTQNSLIRRDAGGTEMTLVTGPVCNTKIYICGEKIFYQSQPGEVDCVNLNGEGGASRCAEGYIAYVDFENDLLLVCQGDAPEYVLTNAATGTTLAGAESQVYFIGEEEGIITYAVLDSTRTILTVHQVQADGANNCQIGTIDTGYAAEDMQFQGIEAGGFVDGPDIYVSYIQAGGSYLERQNGGIVRMDANTGESQVLVDPSSPYPLVTENIYRAQLADGTGVICFAGGEGSSMHGDAVHPWLDAQNTFCLNMDTGEISQSAQPFIPEGSFAIVNGEAIMRQNGSDQTEVVLSADDLRAAGYTQYSDLSAGDIPSLSSIRSIDRVGDTLYVEIVRSHRDASQDAGWRPAYVFDSLTAYVKQPGGTLTQLSGKQSRTVPDPGSGTAVPADFDYTLFTADYYLKEGSQDISDAIGTANIGDSMGDELVEQLSSDQGFANAVRAWKNLNVGKSPVSNITGQAMDQIAYYELAVYDILKLNLYSSSFMDALDNVRISDMITIYQKTADIFGINTSGQTIDKTLNQVSKMTQDTAISDLSDQNVKLLKGLSASLDFTPADAPDLMLNSSKTIYEYLQSILDYSQTQYMMDSQVDVLETMYGICSTKETAPEKYTADIDMLIALSNVLSASRSAADRIGTSVTKTGTKLSADAMDDLWKEMISAASPFMKGTVIGNALSRAVMNITVNTDDTIKAYYMMKNYCEVQALLGETVDMTREAYQKDRTHKNAAAFVTAVDMAFVSKENCNRCAMDMMENIFASGLWNRLTDADNTPDYKAALKLSAMKMDEARTENILLHLGVQHKLQSQYPEYAKAAGLKKTEEASLELAIKPPQIRKLRVKKNKFTLEWSLKDKEDAVIGYQVKYKNKKGEDSYHTVYIPEKKLTIRDLSLNCDEIRLRSYSVDRDFHDVYSEWTVCRRQQDGTWLTARPDTDVFSLVGKTWRDVKETAGGDPLSVQPLSSEMPQVYTAQASDTRKLFFEIEDVIKETDRVVMAEVPLTEVLPVTENTNVRDLADALADHYSDVVYSIWEFPLGNPMPVYAGSTYVEYSFGVDAREYFMDIALNGSSDIAKDANVRIYRKWFSSTGENKPYEWLTQTANSALPFPEYIFSMKYVGTLETRDESRVWEMKDSSISSYTPQQLMEAFAYAAPEQNEIDLTPGQIIEHENFLELTDITFENGKTYDSEEEIAELVAQYAKRDFGFDGPDFWPYYYYRYPDGKYVFIDDEYYYEPEEIYSGSILLSKDAVIKSEYNPWLNDRPVRELFTEPDPERGWVQDYRAAINKIDTNGYITELRVREWD